jgi:iron complex outermembrane recepter protein
MNTHNLILIATLLISSFCYSQTIDNTIVTENSSDTSHNTTNDTVRNKKGEILEEVLVTSKQQNKPVSIGKSDINPMDLPQSIAIINHTLISSQQVNSMSDLLKNANGVYIMGTTGGYQEEVASRGFALSSSNTFKNGIRYFNGMTTELSGIEKVEFLKGSAAILFGNVSAGGILNFVTKKPKFNFGGETGFRTGSFSVYKPTFDIYGPINNSKSIAFRINGTFEKGNSFRDYVNAEKKYFNPSFLIKFSQNTELLIEGDYIKDRRTPDFGAGIINYEIVNIPRNRFLGVSWGYYDSQQVSATATLTHKIDERWSVNFINGIRFYQTDLFSNTRPNSGTNGTIKANGDWTRSVQRATAKDNYFIQQLDLKGNFKTGRWNHQFLIGIDTETFKTESTAYTSKTYDTSPINIFKEYNPINEAPIPTLDINNITNAPIKRVGTYIQDLVSLSEKWKILSGIRYSYQDTQSEIERYTNNKPNTIKPEDITSNYTGAFSPRIGLIFQPTTNHSLFASYSNSFDINTGQDDFGNTLSPSIVDQFEIGIKNKFFDERLFFNVTTYQIKNDKLYQQSLNNGNTYSYIKVLAGEVKSQGLEIDIIANPVKGLTILAGYSFNETKFINSDYYIPGSFLRYNPKNTANLNASYNFESGQLKGLNFGLINTYFGERYAGRSTRLLVAGDTRKLIYLKDYFQIDATLGYTFKNMAIRTKLSNIANQLNYNVHDDNSLNPIAPRNYSVAVNYTF